MRSSRRRMRLGRNGRGFKLEIRNWGDNQKKSVQDQIRAWQEKMRELFERIFGKIKPGSPGPPNNPPLPAPPDFYYPTGGKPDKFYAWFGKTDAEGYIALDKYGNPRSPIWHCGTDIQCKVGDPVYAVSDGVVVKVSTGGWSNDESNRENFGYVICHTLSNEDKFIAVYGPSEPSCDLK